ncbi:ubiquinone biosynthesis accessory factor UbiJ [Tepidimonas sp.]|uniref:ubiquinone biosynthesis accessory factor UbiJ n=1 Tax=Tepidimonas sp. TaxID=2002775 RepID=UPI002FE0F7E9
MNRPSFFARRDTQGRWTLPEPPPWLQDELRNRVLVLLNHVLQQEPAAMERLRRHAGKVVRVQVASGGVGPLGWPALQWPVRLSPAGLLQSAAGQERAADLTLTIDEPAPLALLQRIAAGERPQVAIEGDVQLAAEVAWVVDHVRWDVEEDLARLLGDAAAHTLVQQARALTAALRRWLGPAAQAARRRSAQWAQRWRPAADPNGTDPAGEAAP